ncbi:MAG: N-6 DNA methylase [Caldilineaceae bacterium]|nr:N-6 DNA methylase [Caldilineaceae bacterium]
MLDAETKRRIDTSRDILVGKVPDPKSQVEQITIALIYKFMDDIDAESEEFGGKRTFFAGDFARYGWAKLMHHGLGGHEMLNLYAEAIERMDQNPGIPQLFRDIFSNAFLPYRDPETLRAFLKVIDGFTYDHSERLGDAFEYLLSVMDSQGDAGQFRTPRHIIDFIVSIVDPKKDEIVLDPACGTAGFLISSYKHILAANIDADANSTLTPDDRARLARNFTGYDISPDMVRLSLVNMYLHGFVDPHIHEYDTLTSEERWNEFADVILANPPFMSPKGGIRPHNRFSIKSKRSEVLFVDYMAEHLSAGGRAGIIVPEGIIFQSQNAHKRLRKKLVEESLVAVVSLPAGVFNPYSGVKTSILLLDKALARKTDRIAFFKVENDGYDLGAQRRPIDKDDLPRVRNEIGAYLQRLREDDGPPASATKLAEKGAEYTTAGSQKEDGLIVEKEKLATEGEYSLSGERYRIVQLRHSRFPMRNFEDVCTLEYGKSLPKTKRVHGPYPVVGSNGVTGFHNCFLIEGPAIVIGRKGSAGEVTLIEQNCFPIDTTYFVKQTNSEESDISFLYWILRSLNLQRLKDGAGIPGLNRNDVYYAHKIPLPPLEAQREIVAEIEGYQKVIDGARAVVENYRPRILVDPEWPLVEIGKVCNLVNGRAFKPSDWEDANSGGLPIVRIQNLNNPMSGFNYYTGEVKDRHTIEDGELLFSWSGSKGTSFGAHIWRGGKAILNQHIFRVDYDDTDIRKMYLHCILNRAVAQVEQNLHGGVGLVHITKGNLEQIHIPIPALEIQEALVAEIETEQSLVDANRELIRRFEKKIQKTIGRVWEGNASDA